MVIFLIRHGNREPYERELVRPVRLVPDGHQQAQRLASVLACQGIEAVYSSPKIRAVETALPLAQLLGLTVEVWPCLIEHDGYGPQDWSRAALRMFPVHVDETKILSDAPEQEDLSSAYLRAEYALAKLRQSGRERVAVFAHDYFNSIFLWAWLGSGCRTEKDRFYQGPGNYNVLDDDNNLLFLNQSCSEAARG